MAVGNALMDMYNEMQAELAERQGGANAKAARKIEKAPKPKAVSTEAETDKMYCPECGEPLVFDKMYCPECGEPLVFEEGCNICKCCGWSKCH